MTTGVEIRICPISGDSELELFTEVLPIVSFKQKFKIGNVTFVLNKRQVHRRTVPME